MIIPPDPETMALMAPDTHKPGLPRKRLILLAALCAVLSLYPWIDPVTLNWDADDQLWSETIALPAASAPPANTRASPQM